MKEYIFYFVVVVLLLLLLIVCLVFLKNNHNSSKIIQQTIINDLTQLGCTIHTSYSLTEHEKGYLLIIINSNDNISDILQLIISLPTHPKELHLNHVDFDNDVMLDLNKINIDSLGFYKCSFKKVEELEFGQPIQTLVINCCELPKHFLQNFVKSKISNIHFIDTGIDDLTIYDLRRFPELSVCRFNHLIFEDSWLNELFELKQVKEVNIDDTNYSGSIDIDLLEKSTVEKISLNRCNLLELDFSTFTNFSRRLEIDVHESLINQSQARVINEIKSMKANVELVGIPSVTSLPSEKSNTQTDED